MSVIQSNWIFIRVSRLDLKICFIGWRAINEGIESSTFDTSSSIPINMWWHIEFHILYSRFCFLMRLYVENSGPHHTAMRMCSLFNYSNNSVGIDQREIYYFDQYLIDSSDWKRSQGYIPISFSDGAYSYLSNRFFVAIGKYQSVNCLQHKVNKDIHFKMMKNRIRAQTCRNRSIFKNKLDIFPHQL